MMKLSFFTLLCFVTSIFSYIYSQDDIDRYDQSICFSIDSHSVHVVNQKPEQGLYAASVKNSSVNNLSDSEFKNLVMQAIRSEIICRQVFHMSVLQKEQMKRLSYDDFVTALLARQDLSDQAIMALWNEYKNKRVWNWSNEKEENEIKIKQWLQQRKQRRMKQNHQYLKIL